MNKLQLIQTFFNKKNGKRKEICLGVIAVKSSCWSELAAFGRRTATRRFEGVLETRRLLLFFFLF